jgi:hypothetical protein
MPTFLQGIAKKAKEQPKHRFGVTATRNLYELLNETYLKECWHDIPHLRWVQVSAKTRRMALTG